MTLLGASGYVRSRVNIRMSRFKTSSKLNLSKPRNRGDIGNREES